MTTRWICFYVSFISLELIVFQLLWSTSSSQCCRSIICGTLLMEYKQTTNKRWICVIEVMQVCHVEVRHIDVYLSVSYIRNNISKKRAKSIRRVSISLRWIPNRIKTCLSDIYRYTQMRGLHSLISNNAN